MIRLAAVALGLLAAVASCVGGSAGGAWASGPCGRAKPPRSWKHVVWIWMENHSYEQIIGNGAAPYVNRLAHACGLATNYSAVTHPSLPNYIAATSGDTWGIVDDFPPSSHPLGEASIFSQLADAGKTWRSYEESMPSACATDSAGIYQVKHNPAAYYVGISGACQQADVPLGTTSSGPFVADLRGNRLPSFSFVTPNMCSDMHDCSVETGDAWLRQWVPRIVDSPGYRARTTVLVITFDEGEEGGTNRIPTIVVSPSTPPGTRPSGAFTHYSLLKTTEQLLGLRTYLGHAGDPSTASMRTAFRLG